MKKPRPQDICLSAQANYNCKWQNHMNVYVFLFPVPLLPLNKVPETHRKGFFKILGG